MISRRELTLASLGLVTAGTAEALRPRRRLRLLQSGTKIDAILPHSVGTWHAQASDGLVAPDLEGKLAKSLYREIVSRVYYDDVTSAGIMLLAAYGDTQSDLLQLHRPETCYPAVGFALRSREAFQLPIGPGANLPCSKVVAFTPERTENILYWTRVGEALPQNLREQRRARFQNAVDGVIADGILMRFSVVGETEQAFAALQAFVPAFIRSIPHDSLAGLIGTRLSNAIKA